MIYCFIRETGIRLFSKNAAESHTFNPQPAPSQSENTGKESSNSQDTSIRMMMKNLSSGDFRNFLNGHIQAFTLQNGTRIQFILDDPWADVRYISLPPHKKGKTRQILALNLSGEFIQEIENIIFDFYLLPSENNQHISVVYACSKALSEMINGICVAQGLTNMGVTPYTHLTETLFSAENKNLQNHIHISIDPENASFFCYSEGKFFRHLAIKLSGNRESDFQKIRQRLNILMADIPDFADFTLNHENSHIYPYIGGHEDAVPDEINEVVTYQKLHDMIAQTAKKRRTLNLTRIQNPFLLDILRAKKLFIRAAMIWGAIILVYICFKGVVYYLNTRQYEKLNTIVLKDAKAAVPEAKSVQNALTVITLQKNELKANWLNRQELSYRSYRVSSIMNRLEKLRAAVEGAEFATMRYDGDYIEISGTVKQLSDINSLQSAGEQEFSEYSINIEQKTIGGSLSFTVKMNRKTDDGKEEKQQPA